MLTQLLKRERDKMMITQQLETPGAHYTRAEVQAIADQIQRLRPGFNPKIGMMIGTGFHGFTETIQNQIVIPYTELPLFANELGLKGHVPELVLGQFNGHDIIVTRGKMHLLEGLPAQRVVLPVRLFHLLGVKTLVYSNTAGGVNPSFKVGEFVFLHNNINLMARNPLLGEKVGEWGEMFFDMTYPYDAELREMAKEKGRALGFKVQEGVYAGLLGPSFETAAEIHMLSVIGADLVGMSTIMETIAARQLGMRMLGICFVANMAAGVGGQTLVEDEWLDNPRKHRQDFERLFTSILAELCP